MQPWRRPSSPALGQPPSATTPAASAAAPAPDTTGTPAFVPPFRGDLLTQSPEPTHSSTSTEDPRDAEQPFEEVISRSLPAVASIDTGSARGSGFFVRPETVVTNAHVVNGQSSVQLVAGGRAYSARVAALSPALDLALLQVSNPDPRQPVLSLGKTARVQAGKEVVAIGYALGTLSNTVTRGIVSAVRRVNTLTLLQIDAAINPGNSGGPLIDRTGTVIGINTLGASGQGLGFAVAAEHADQLLNGQAPIGGETPLASLQQAMGAPTGGDAERSTGTAQWTEALQNAAQAADQLDTYWGQYAGSCLSGPPRTSGDRPWFAVLEPGGVRLADSQVTNCGSWHDGIRTRALQLRDFLRTRAEAARRAGLYPGTVREMRHKYRHGWEG
jgi:S1-C subfamily serine protease